MKIPCLALIVMVSTSVAAAQVDAGPVDPSSDAVDAETLQEIREAVDALFHERSVMVGRERVLRLPEEFDEAVVEALAAEFDAAEMSEDPRRRFVYEMLFTKGGARFEPGIPILLAGLRDAHVRDHCLNALARARAEDRDAAVEAITETMRALETRIYEEGEGLEYDRRCVGMAANALRRLEAWPDDARRVARKALADEQADDIVRSEVAFALVHFDRSREHVHRLIEEAGTDGRTFAVFQGLTFVCVRDDEFADAALPLIRKLSLKMLRVDDAGRRRAALKSVPALWRDALVVEGPDGPVANPELRAALQWLADRDRKPSNRDLARRMVESMDARAAAAANPPTESGGR